MSSLPDKGAKIKQFVETLERTINSREKSQEMCRKLDTSEMKTNTSMIIKDGHKGASRFKKEREKVKLKEDIDRDNEMENERILKTDSDSEQMAFTGDVLERSFQTLTVTDEADEERNSSASKPVHQYQLAEERAKHNAEVLKEPLKLNRYRYILSSREPIEWNRVMINEGYFWPVSIKTKFAQTHYHIRRTAYQFKNSKNQNSLFLRLKWESQVYGYDMKIAK